MSKKVALLGFGFLVLANGVADASSFASTYSFTGLNDGGTPIGGLVADSAGDVFGTTSSGGSNGQGTIFELTPSGQFSTLATFNGSSTGGAPQGSLVLKGTVLYGTTSAGGGAGGHGTIFGYNLTSHKLATLHVFLGSDGATPKGALWLEPSGSLVGTTYGGGANNFGAVYRYTISSKQLSLVYSFTGGTTDGANPDSGVIEDSSGNIYGTTFFGGSLASGTLYKISGSTESVLFNVGSDNCCGFPVAEPTFDSAGNIYTPVRGSIYEGGLELTIPSGTTHYISSLGGPGGPNNPNGQALEGAPLIVGGTLYITCAVGGQNDSGTIASVALTSNYPITVIHNFTGADGYQPSGKLARTKAGAFFGTTQSGGTYGYGTLFSFTP